MDIRKTIEQYTDKIVKGKFRAPDRVCKKCEERPGEYKLHECRKRQVRFSAQAIVEIAMTFVLRWKCSLCEATFTQYPPFIAPHKRFLLPEIVRLSRKYLEDDNCSYAGAVVEDGCRLCYLDERGLCDKFMSRSTVWRFMDFLASAPFGEEDEPAKQYRRRTPVLPSRKYRSEKRRVILHRALQAVGRFARRPFFRPFPDLATPFL